MNKKLLLVLMACLAIASVSAVSAGLFGGNTVNVNGIDFNVPDGFENMSIPSGMDNMLGMDNSVALVNASSQNWVMIDSADKLVEIPENQINESKNMNINGKEGTYNTFYITNANGKQCHFFDYEQDNKKVRVVVFSDDDGQNLLKGVIK